MPLNPQTFDPFAFFGSDSYVPMPTGGGFSPSGMVAPWRSLHVYSLMTQIDDISELHPDFTRTAGSSGWKTLYYKDPLRAAEVAREIESGNPNHVWLTSAKKAEIINLGEAAQEAFGDEISYEIHVMTYGSAKLRHEFHLIALPRSVYALAKLLTLDVPEFDLSELLDQNRIYNDDFFASYCGARDAKPKDEQYFTNSTLWQRRSALWAALGESDPFTYLPIGAAGDAKYVTHSPQLSSCLSAMQVAWRTPRWARIVSVFDPRVDAVTKSSDPQRLRLPVIWDIYADESEARAAVAGTSSEARGMPSLPVSWAAQGVPAEQWVAEFRKAAAGKPNTPPANAAIAKALDVSGDDVSAWRAHLNV